MANAAVATEGECRAGFDGIRITLIKHSTTFKKC